MKPELIFENTWAVEDEGVRFFILAGAERALVIDTGRSGLDIRSIVNSVTALPYELISTHADPDHIAGNRFFNSFYMHPADEPHYRSTGKSGTLVPLQDGDEIDLGSRKLKIIHLPGHTPGSIAVLDVSRRILISGDPIQEHGRIFMFGEHRSMRDYIASLEKLEKRTAEFDKIWPSHSDLPLRPDCIPRLREGAESILAGKAEGHSADFYGQKIMVYDLGFTSFLCNS